MADYNSSLPVRTQTAGDVIVKLADSVTPSQQAQVTAARELSVLASAQPGVDIGDVTINNAAGAAAVNVQDGGNSLTVDGTVELGAASLAALESITVQNGAGGAAVNIQDGGNSITVDGAVTVSATDLDIRDLDAAQDSVEVIQGTSPWIVQDAGSAGDPVHSYDTQAALAAAGEDAHSYTVTAATTLHLTQIEASASDKLRIEVQVEDGVATDSYDTFFMGFNSSANPNISFKINPPLEVAAGVRVRVLRLNRSSEAQDVYSTISGFEV